MTINKPIKKRNFKKFIEIITKNHLRINGWHKTYEDYKEFISQNGKQGIVHIDTEVSNDNQSNHNC